MEEKDQNVQDHVDSVKTEMKEAASAIAESAKEHLHDAMDSAKGKVNDVVGNVATAKSGPTSRSE